MRRLPSLAASWLPALGAVLWVRGASAYCREVTLGPPSNYDPTVAGCFGAGPNGSPFTAQVGPDGGVVLGSDGNVVAAPSADAGLTLYPLFWRNQCVSYSFQQAGAKNISASDTTRIAAQAFAAWSTAPCPGGPPVIEADLFPAVTCDNPQSQAHNNVIIFRDNEWPYDDGSNAIGYTTLTVNTKTGEIFGADIEINTFGFKIVADLNAAAVDAGASTAGASDSGAEAGGAGVPKTDGGGNAQALASGDGGLVLDLGTILTHEAGHFLGLAHSADTNAVMYAHYHAGSTALTSDDIEGICSIYQSDGNRNTGMGEVAAELCNPTPPLGFLTTCGSLDSGIQGLGTVGSGGPGTGADGDGGGDAGVPCPAPPDCAVGASPGAATPTATARWWLSVAFVVGLLRFKRRSLRGSRSSTAGVLLVVGVGASALCSREAIASVSATALFEQLVAESSAVGVVTPIEQRTIWEDSRIITYTRVRAERVVAGRLPVSLWIRTLGGAVGDLAQIVEGQATFALGHPSLVFLREHVDAVTHASTGSFVVMERAQGQFPLVESAGKEPKLTLAADIGALVAPPAEAPRGDGAAHDGRTASEVLRGLSVEKAVHEVAVAWTRLH